MSVNNLPPIPQEQIAEVYSWREWFRNLGTYIQKAQAGGTVWTILQGGTGSGTAAGARQNLGLGSLSTQNADTVNITGGSVGGQTLPFGTIVHQNNGLSVVITTAKLTTLGSNGSMTFTNGVLTAQTQAT